MVYYNNALKHWGPWNTKYNEKEQRIVSFYNMTIISWPKLYLDIFTKE